MFQAAALPAIPPGIRGGTMWPTGKQIFYAGRDHNCRGFAARHGHTGPGSVRERTVMAFGKTMARAA